MEEEDTLYKGSLTHIEDADVSDNNVSSTPWDGNDADTVSNASTGPITCSKSKGQNLTAERFFIISYGVSWLTDSWKNVSS